MADFDLDSIDDMDFNMDFGFTTVDEDEVQEFETAVQEKVAKAVGHESGALEGKIDELNKKWEDYCDYNLIYLQIYHFLLTINLKVLTTCYLYHYILHL